MSLKKIKGQLNNLKSIELDESSSKEMRRALLSKIEKDTLENKVVKKNPISLISIFAPSIRAIVVSLIVILIPGGGFTTVKAAFSSLPGDFLYPVKITTEKIQVAFADKDEKTLFRFELARRRLAEAEEIINKEENGERKVKVALAVEKFKEEIDTITENIESLESESQEELEGQIAILNTEAEKIVEDADIEIIEEDTENILDESNSEATSTEIVSEEVDELLDKLVSEPAKNLASTTIRIVKPIIEEPEEDPESFKIQLQIIED